MSTYTVKFDRIGRNHEPADLVVTLDGEPLDGLAEAVFNHARPHLRSQDVNVDVTDDGMVYITAGFHDAGTGQWTSDDGAQPVTHNPAPSPDWFDAVTVIPRRVALDKVGDVEVSTVDLGIYRVGTDSFETMIFGGDRDGDMWRYPTREQAEQGHQAVVAALREDPQ